MPTVPPFDELIDTAHQSAVHLETRDSYVPSDPVYRRWLAGEHVDFTTEAAPGWAETVRKAVGRGVAMRRVRVVSEPVSSYVRFEYESTEPLNVAAGEDVRWISRREAFGIGLPALDFWLFDDHTARVHHFDGDGEIVEDELVTDPGLIRHCAEAFAALWDRAVPHADFDPR